MIAAGGLALSQMNFLGEFVQAKVKELSLIHIYFFILFVFISIPSFETEAFLFSELFFYTPF